MLVEIHDEELAKLDVLVPFQRHAVIGPAQPLQVDAETLRELWIKDTVSGQKERISAITSAIPRPPKLTWRCPPSPASAASQTLFSGSPCARSLCHPPESGEVEKPNRDTE